MDTDALYAAAIAGDVGAIAQLAMEADNPNEDRETILHTESIKGNTERVRFILRELAHKNLLAKLSSYKQTALHLAAYYGRTEVAEILIHAASYMPVTSFQAFLRQGDQDSDTALHAAVMDGNVATVKLLVEADQTDTHIQNSQGKSPMYIAVEKGFDDIVKIISTTCTAPSLDGPYGSIALRIKNLDHAESPGRTSYKIMDRYALYVAAIEGDADAIAKLEKRADKLHGGEETLLDVESQNGYAARVRFILREFAKKYFLPKLSNYKQTALHLAATNGHTEVAEILIDAAKHLSPSDDDNLVTFFQAFLRQADQKNKDTALHSAVKKGHASIVKLLVEADPTDKHIQNADGKTPMYIAVEQGYNDIVKIISTTCTTPSLDGPDGSSAVRIKNPDLVKAPGGTLYNIMDKDALYAAVIAGDADAIAALEMQADRRINPRRETILHTECENGNAEGVRFILREFADKNLLVKLNMFEQTPLHLAAHRGRTEVAEVLIDAARHLPSSSFQAFLRQADQYKETALHKAAENSNVAMVKLLVDADPSYIHTQNSNGKTPIYLAWSRGRYETVKMICTTCTGPLNLDGPDGTTTILHDAIKYLDQGDEKDKDMIRTIIEAVKRLNKHENADQRDERLIKFFNKTDKRRCIILELAVEGNYLDMVKLILAQNPAYHRLKWDPDLVGLMPLIYKAKSKNNSNMIDLLTQTYQNGVQSVNSYYWRSAYMPKLISAISRRKEESVLGLLNDDYYVKELVIFADNLGWTALHHAAYHEFNSIIDVIIEAQKKFEHSFVYEDMVSTPFHVAAERGYTSTVICLMHSWPSSSSAYTAVDKNGQNILHLAALQSKKEMILGILKYCREEHKNEFVNKRDNNGDTPLHLLIRRGCFLPQFLRYEGLEIRIKNKKELTAPDMLYFEDQIIDDQIDQKRDVFSSLVLSSTRERKDVIFHEQANQMKLAKHERIQVDTHAIAKCFAEAIEGDPISKAALEMEADIPKEEGKTILHIESMKGNTKHVQFILTEFAYKNLLGELDRSEQTALHLAALHRHTKVVEVLVDAARPNFPSANTVSSFHDFIRQANGQGGNTALHLAVLKNNVEIVKLLVVPDPNVSDVQNNEGKTPVYIAAENGYKDIVKEICTVCTALSLDGPGGRTTALHALMKNIGRVTEGAKDLIRMMIHAAKCWSSAEDPSLVKFKALFSRTDESGSTLLQLAMERNYVEAVELILLEDPAYQHGHEIKRSSLMRLIHKAIDNKYSDDIIELLCRTYKAGINPEHKDVLALILAIRRRDEDSVLGHLRDAKKLVTFKEDNGWTPLHYAVYHEFDSILGAIIEAQEDVGHQFVYQNMVSTPFHVAVKHGYMSTAIRLMQSWPAPSSAVTAANSPYTSVDEIGQNILHLAAAGNKEMVQSILKYCPEKYKEEILKQQDNNGDTPLHLLISHGCFIPELIKHKGLDTMPRNKNDYTPQDMLYFKSDIVADQVHIKIALDELQTNLWTKSTVSPSKQRIKDVIFDERIAEHKKCIAERKKKLMDEEQEQTKKDLAKYKMRTNTQIIVTALITTVTFTVGFTMPGGLRQSGEVDEGLVLLSKKKAFNAFMVSDALALLLSTSSLFFYFLESMNDDPQQVAKLNTASTVLNIISVVAMMLTFIAGTYVVLSHSPVLAIIVCVIGSLFFLLIIVISIKAVYDRQVKRKKN